MDFYAGDGSLFVEAYDALYSGADPHLGPIVAFYERLARKVGGPVLELACGTGRIALPLAKAGLHVTASTDRRRCWRSRDASSRSFRPRSRNV